MQREVIVKGRSLGGASDLTLLAPIRRGLVDSLESVSYKTRIKRVLDLLHSARQASHEHAAARLLSDAVERVGVIHSVRVAVLEPADQVMLAVTFDGPWEAYIRVLWDKVGSLLDLIFCGTEGYVVAATSSFADWQAWARTVQVETGFFYGPAESSAIDALYLRRVQRQRERLSEGAPADANAGAGVPPPPGLTPLLAATLAELRTVQPTAEEATTRLVDLHTPQPDDPPYLPLSTALMSNERVRTGLQAMAALYRLTDLHRPGTPDGDVLWRAAHNLLREFVMLLGNPVLLLQTRNDYGWRFERQLQWLIPGEQPEPPRRERPPRPRGEPVAAAVREDAQGGILRGYARLTHGVALLLALDTPAAAQAFISDTLPLLTRDADDHGAAAGTVYRNVSFTAAGLRAAGLDEDTLALFDSEFLQGMAARAGLLGDVRHNHPRRWHLPRQFQGLDEPEGDLQIELDSVHAVLLLRCEAPTVAQRDARSLQDPNHPLRDEVARIHGLAEGLRLLALQPLLRHEEAATRANRTETVIHEHFGYADGNGQPNVEDGDEWNPANRVHLGEVLLGHANASDPAPPPADPQAALQQRLRRHWLHNGSFHVVRKYRQFPERLHQAVSATASEMARVLGGTTEEHLETVYGKLMGRQRSGAPIVDTAAGVLNAFSYAGDPDGRQCPLHAHIRRANPRAAASSSARPPRLMRRSMSWGPRLSVDPRAERGLLFMAYNANLGEQFEVVQRWLVGANSSGSSSAVSCPIVGVPENGLAREFRFEIQHGGREHVFHVRLETPHALFDDPAVLTRLDWGLYLFAPSATVLRRLGDLAGLAAARNVPALNPVPWSLQRGRELLQALLKLDACGPEAQAREAWKLALEDPQAIDRMDAAAVWDAIRSDHGGLLKTSYGTLVASRDLVQQVYIDALERYSVRGQLERMRLSFGEISLGMDAGALYDEQAGVINAAIGALHAQDVFDIARRAAGRRIARVVADARQRAALFEKPRYETAVDAREIMDDVLADLSEAWFGIQDDPHQRLRRGAADWSWQAGQPPLYPGHFTALSRYMFQPHPGPVPVELGQAYGRALHDAMLLFVQDHRKAGTMPRQPALQDSSAPAPWAPLAEAVFTHAKLGHDNEYIARTMVGVLMGFNPTIYGAVLNVLREWRREGLFGSLRVRLKRRTSWADARQVLDGALRQAAQMRPMPQLGWRTVRKAHRLEVPGQPPVNLADGDRVVMAMVSATQQSLADGLDDGRLMFGGKREDKPAPTHACPGYGAGMAAMLGALVGLLAADDDVREGPTPLGYVLAGPTNPPAALAEAVAAVKAQAERGALLRRGTVGLKSTGAKGGPAARTRSGYIAAWGDSWLAYDFAFISRGRDVRDWLTQFGYRVPDTFCSPGRWGTIARMARDRDLFLEHLDALLQAKPWPRAVLLSGGGNDSTGAALEKLFNPRASDPALNDSAVKAHVRMLQMHYEEILTDVAASFKGAQVTQGEIPVIVHGYDHPIPRGAGLLGDGPLLRPFAKHGYQLPHNAIDLARASQAMADLIDAFNAMLAGLPKAFPFVRHVRLTGIIANALPSGQAADGWADDLHPTSALFELLAQKIDAAL